MALEQVEPLLSICIPTLNRAELLEVSLENILSEAVAFADEVEVVVSDNASSDRTPDVLAAYADRVRFQRLPSTVGFTRNVFSTTCDLARGRFLWVLGDDDMIIRGSLARIMDSLHKHPDIDYHYLNFGWIDVKARTAIVREMDSVPPNGPGTRWQCDKHETLELERIEDLTLLPGKNPSALFSGIFCFVTLRDLYLSQRHMLKPSDSLDGSSILMDDCFPHAIITLPRMAGRRIMYLGQPCLLQGINAWEWGRYAYKNMLFGTQQLFSWLEGTLFAKDGMDALWHSYHQMAGHLFLRMLTFKEEHLGMDLVMQQTMPFSAPRPEFWEAFLEEARLVHECDIEARILAETVEMLLKERPTARVGLWGILGRGHQFIKSSPASVDHLVWVADRDSTLHGNKVEWTSLTIQSPDSLPEADLDILVLGTRRDLVDTVSTTASPRLKSGAVIVSVKGVQII